jgi:hypothetical protein
MGGYSHGRATKLQLANIISIVILFMKSDSSNNFPRFNCGGGAHTDKDWKI